MRRETATKLVDRALAMVDIIGNDKVVLDVGRLHAEVEFSPHLSRAGRLRDLGAWRELLVERLVEGT